MRIKICGLKTHQDVAAVNSAKPDYAGFVFAASKRQVSAEKARELLAALDANIIAVGVFADSSAEQVARLYESGLFAAAQLHGNEDEQMIAGLKSRCPKLELIKAYTPLPGADYLLLDNARPGSGLPLAESEEEYEQLGRRIAASPLPVFLAGGINTNNIKRALALRPWCIDVSSGAETDGKKDAEKIQQLVAACREPKAANTARKPPNSPKEGA